MDLALKIGVGARFPLTGSIFYSDGYGVHGYSIIESCVCVPKLLLKLCCWKNKNLVKKAIEQFWLLFFL